MDQCPATYSLFDDEYTQFSQPPEGDPSASAFPVVGAVPALVGPSGWPYTCRTPSVLEDASLQQKLQAYRALPSSSEWRAANDTFKHDQLLDLFTKSWVANEILDASLALVIRDLGGGVWDTAFGMEPEASRPDLSKVVVMTWAEVFYMMKGSPLDQPGGLVPPKKTTKMWFPKVRRAGHGTQPPEVVN